MTIEQASAALRSRSISVAELTEQHLRKIDETNPKLNAFLTITAEQARAAAQSLDRELSSGADRGPLHGIPVAIKDMYATKGIRTTCGSPIFGDNVPDHDSAVVERLQAAGAVILGKTGLHELCYGITSNNVHFGPVRNPVDPERIPGGSSGGSAAAVASGMALAAMGSDTGGSIRIPASFCGCVGIKPTYGLVSRFGAMPLSLSMDHMGPLTRTVRDAALVLQAIAGPDRRDPSTVDTPVPRYLPAQSKSLDGVRLGWPTGFFFDLIDPEVQAAVEHQRDRAAALGAQIVPIEVPSMDACNTLGRVLLLAEASALYANHWDRRAEMSAEVLALFDQGRLLPATDYINAQRLRRTIQLEWQQMWTKVDCLLAPCTPTTAPLIGQDTVRLGGREENIRLATTRLMRGINVLGVPSLAMPAGVATSGLPIGMQIIGPPFEETLLFRVGAALESTD